MFLLPSPSHLPALPASPLLQQLSPWTFRPLVPPREGGGGKEREKGSAIVQKGQSQQLWFRKKKKKEEVIKCHNVFSKAQAWSLLFFPSRQRQGLEESWKGKLAVGMDSTNGWFWMCCVCLCHVYVHVMMRYL